MSVRYGNDEVRRRLLHHRGWRRLLNRPHPIRIVERMRVVHAIDSLCRWLLLLARFFRVLLDRHPSLKILVRIRHLHISVRIPFHAAHTDRIQRWHLGCSCDLGDVRLKQRTRHRDARRLQPHDDLLPLPLLDLHVLFPLLLLLVLLLLPQSEVPERKLHLCGRGRLLQFRFAFWFRASGPARLPMRCVVSQSPPNDTPVNQGR